MSIGAKPWEGGGAATVPDASETTKGKIRIATSAEATTGTDDLTAMTPLTVKERIDAAIAGGIEYKGTFDASTGLPSLANAEQGDLYKVSTAGTIYGKSWAVGDHLLINADMGGTVTPSKIDKVDNTESVTSVNGQTGATSLGIGDLNNVVISGGGAGGDLVEYDAVDGRWENVTKASINVGDFNDDATYQLRDAGLTSIAGLTTSADKMIYATASDTYAVTDLTAAGRALLDDADATAQRTTLGLGTAATSDTGDFLASTAALNDLSDVTISSVSNGQVISYNSTSGEWENSTPASGGATDLNGLSDVTITSAASGNLLQHNGSGQFVNVAKSTINVGDFNDDSTYQPLDAQLTDVAGLTPADGAFIVGDGANFVAESGATARTSLGLTIGTDVQAHDAQLDDVAGLTPADGAVIIGDGANFVTESGATARASLGLTIGTDVQAYDAQLADVAGLTPADGAFIVGDGVNFVTESLATARTSLGLGTAATSASSDFLASTAGINDLSDVTITSVTNGQVISYNSTSGEWENSTPASGGATDLDGLSDVTITSASSGQILRNNGSGQFVNVALSIVDDTTPQLGGALDVNGQAITSASNGNVTINPDGTGDISVGADIIPDADATHTLGSEDNRFITLHSELNGAVQFKARNETGGPLTKGQAVYISGVSGDVPLVSLARANSASTMPAHGLLAADVSNNADVQVISFGNLTAYNTTTHSLSLGDTVYVSAATAGALTSSAPAGETNLIQNIGKVVRASATEGIIKVGGAGRSAATPNLDNGKIFLGNGSNQAVSTALSSAAVTSFNTQTGALTIGGDDLTADHTASNYTPANANIDGHLSGIDDELLLKAPLASPSLTGTPTAPTATQGDNSTQLATTAYVDTAVSAGGGGVDPTLTVVSNTTYTLSAANAPGIHIWYGASNSSTFTVTMPDISNVLSTAVSVNGDPGPTFEVYIGRGQAGDITVSAADGIDLLGDGSITYSTTQTVDSGQWVKLVGWYASGSTQRYLMDSAAQPRDAGLTSISGLTTAADKMIYTTASDTYAVTDLTSAGRAILDDADAAAQRTTLGLVIGTDVLGDVVDDTTPQLGGNLDTNGQDIVTTSNADLDLAPDGTGAVVLRGNTTGGNNQGKIKFNCENNSHAVTIQGPAHSAAATYTLTLPVNDGDPDQVLKTDGSGVLSWVDQSGGGGGWTYSAITADPANAQAGYHYSCTGTFTITLPTTGVSAGEEVRIKNMGTGTITVDPQTSNIDGSTTDYVMDIQYSAITLVSTGTHWEII